MTDTRSAAPPTVYVIDDDAGLRGVLEALVASVGLGVRTFRSASEFLETYQPAGPGCVLSDVRMPGMSGLELLEALRTRGLSLPVILMTSYADVSLAVRALRSGASDLVQKPLSHQDLLDRLRQALHRDSAAWSRGQKREDVLRRFARLTPRERSVFERVVQGTLNKEIADELELSVKTVELHRAHLMEKMEAASLAELVRMAVVMEAEPEA